jgi:hypothetical protein
MRLRRWRPGAAASVVRHRSDRICRASWRGRSGGGRHFAVESGARQDHGRSAKGDPIPEGWALDPDGRPTTDAKAAMAGTMIPLGDAKGTALALMVELLCAGLTGANYAWQATSFFDDKGDPPGTGQAIIAIDPDAFGPGGAERMALMAQMVAGTEGARLPGRRRQQIRAIIWPTVSRWMPYLADQAIEAIGI